MAAVEMSEEMLEILECPKCYKIIYPPIYQVPIEEEDRSLHNYHIMAAVETSEETLEIFDCPVCYETMYPPIYQCPNGHGICSKCKVTVNNKCPICREQLGDIRCLLLEKILSTMTLRCRYQSKGCTELVPYDSKAKHEDSCRFRPYSCPHSCHPCDVKGDDIPSLLAHMRDVHHCSSSIKSTNVIDSVFEIQCFFGKGYNPSDLSVYKYMGDHFCLHVEALPTDNLYGVFLRFVGEDVDARGYRYSLEVGSDHKGRMMWVGVPKSIRETNQQIGESCELMIIHEKVLQKLAETNSSWGLSLRVRGFIWRGDVFS